MAILRIPCILWGASFANTLNLGYPLDNAVSWDEEGPDAEWIDGDGFTDSWDSFKNYFLVGDIRWIPTANTTDPVTATGWDTASTGFRLWLADARAGNSFKWVYDKTDTGTYVTSRLVEPRRGQPGLEDDGTRRLRIQIRNNSAAYTGY